MRLSDLLTRDGSHSDPFTYASNGQGMRGTVWNTGRLPADWARTYEARSHLITYTITSYGTPVAWCDVEAGWIVPAVRYSVTTSRMQTVIRTALSHLGIDYSE